MRVFTIGFAIALVFGAALALLPAAALAGQGDAACRKAIIDSYLAAVGEEGTRGDAISDGFYGNEPNVVDPFAPGGPSEQEPGTKGGRIVPSQSPGPKVTLPDGTVVQGLSWGEVQQLAKDFCG